MLAMHSREDVQMDLQVCAAAVHGRVRGHKIEKKHYHNKPRVQRGTSESIVVAMQTRHDTALTADVIRLDCRTLR